MSRDTLTTAEAVQRLGCRRSSAANIFARLGLVPCGATLSANGAPTYLWYADEVEVAAARLHEERAKRTYLQVSERARQRHLKRLRAYWQQKAARRAA